MKVKEAKNKHTTKQKQKLSRARYISNLQVAIVTYFFSLALSRPVKASITTTAVEEKEEAKKEERRKKVKDKIYK